MSSATVPIDRIDPPTALCVVGDTFSALAQIDGVRTVSQFVSDLKSGAVLPQRLIAGQGVSDYEMEYLAAALENQRGDVAIEAPATDRVRRHIAHKHREPNVLLADLRRGEGDRWIANLRLHADNELLQDHQTGQHVQGIVIVEAMRQMFISVFEEAHGLRMADKHLFVVWDSMDVVFTSFLFPLPATIECQILWEDLADLSRMGFQVAMDVEQNGVQAAHAEIKFGVHDHDKIRSVEDRRAGKAVRSLLGADPEPTG